MPKKEVLRVRGDLKATYAKLSRIYAVIESKFERRLREKGLKLLDVQQGDRVLEIGFGTGCSFAEIAKAVGETGRAYGIDLTPQMVEFTRKRLEKAGLAQRVELYQGDARQMPFENSIFDAVYIAATLELFDMPDIPRVLGEIKRVLKYGGRLVVVSIPWEGHEDSKLLAIYEWLHRTFPRYASCRPIYAEDSVREAGLDITMSEEIMLAGVFPMKIVLAKRV